MNSKILLPILLATVLFSACSEDFFETTVAIDVPEHTPALAITADFKAGDSLLAVYVTNSVGILENNNYQPIEDATVEVLKDGQPYATLPYFGFNEKFYVLELNEPLPYDQSEYELQVSAPGFEPVSAKQTMPKAVEILSVEYDPEGAINVDGDRVDEFSIEFQDPGGEENFYMLQIWVQQDSFDFSYMLYLDNLDPVAEESGDDLFLKDSSFDGKKYTWKVGTYPGNFEEEGFKYRVELFSVTRDKYFFVRSASLSQDADDNPFAEPVIVHDNIEGGHGIFSLGTKDVEFIDP